MATLWQRLRDAIKRGDSLRYIIKAPTKPPTHHHGKLRGVRITRKDKRISKHKRKMIQASRRRNR